jgi:hypothetical protein
MGEKFVSYQEVQCFKYLNFLGLDLDEVYHEFPIGDNRFDFFPMKEIFWEHHPIRKRLGENIYTYGGQRRSILNRHGYIDVPLVVSDIMFNDIWEICDIMNNHGVDFKNGEIRGDPTIVYIRDFEEVIQTYYNSGMLVDY